MAPVGFQPTSVVAFCGYKPDALNGCGVTVASIDCETGSTVVELPDADKPLLLKRLNARVVGKHSCIITTGGMTVYEFVDASGKPVATFTFYGDLLVMPNGMYSVESVD